MSGFDYGGCWFIILEARIKIRKNRTSTFFLFWQHEGHFRPGVIANILARINIGVRAIFLPGGAVNHLPKIIASCPNFYETVEKKRGSYDALT